LEHLSKIKPGRGQPRSTLLAALVALASAGLAAGGCGGSVSQAKPEQSDPVASKTAEPKPFRFFSPASFWNQALPETAPLDPESSALAATFGAEVAAEQSAGTGPWINTTDYSVPIYTVPANQPTVPVRLASAYNAPALEAAWRRVPLPPRAQPSGGTDGTLVVYQPHSDRLWEFWRLQNSGDGWEASWGGAMRDVSSSSGAYGPKAWPGAKPWWGSSASSLSIAGGLISLEDLRSGRIEHALAMAVPTVRAGVYSSPARRTDGTSPNPLSLPEGAHLRLDPHLDLATLHLPRVTLMIARAAQRYGIFVRDKSQVIHFFAEDPRSEKDNPYAGSDGYFDGKRPSQLLRSFPWNHLQVLQLKLHRSRLRAGSGGG
jgi:hypothetical protein